MDHQRQDPFITLMNKIPSQKQERMLCLHQDEIKVSLEGLSMTKVFQTFQRFSEKIKLKDNIQVRKNWNLQEIQFLAYVVDKYCYVENRKPQELVFEIWKQISMMLPGRSAEQCLFKTLSFRKISLSQFPWSSQEDTIFRNLVQQYGLKWDIISKQLFLRNPSKIYRNSKQCRQHYMCFFNPSNKKGSWSEEQDYKLATYYLEVGRKWSKISKLMEGRNQNSIKNRFFLLFQSRRQGKYRSARDLLSKVQKFKEKYESSSQSQLDDKNITNNEKNSTGDIQSQISNQKNLYRSPTEYLQDSNFDIEYGLNSFHEENQNFLDFLTF